MPIAIQCPSCQAPYTLADALAGKRVRCKKCEAIISVPGGTAEDRLASSPAPARARTPVNAVPIPADLPARRRSLRIEVDEEAPVTSPSRLPVAWIIGLTVAVLLVFGAGLIAYGLTRESTTPESAYLHDPLGPDPRFNPNSIVRPIPNPNRRPAPQPDDPPWPDNPLPPIRKDIPDQAIVIPGDLFTFLEAAVKDNRLADVDVKGFTIGSTYRTVHPEGGVLIGFQIGLGGPAGTNRKEFVVVTALRPIYLTKEGEKMGEWQGPLPAAPITIKAKPGYVVGAIFVRTGVSLMNLTLHFVKLDKDRLQLDDNYDSDCIGGTSNFTMSTIGGKGYFFVGICGRLHSAGHLNGQVCSLGLVTVLLPKK